MWLTDGDENSSYFHKVCTIRQRKNIIKQIEDEEGNTFSINAQIAKTIVAHFQKIYTGESRKNIIIDNLDWRQIETHHHENL